ncbi:hypothetical protein V1264_024286 [Littorina saxatilis]|uniref:Uncharacterized protein n=1 Tax=Littorina saxatilis TaxID=31220 RepID=A0AAN9AKZ5_9CAEN
MKFIVCLVFLMAAVTVAALADDSESDTQGLEQVEAMQTLDRERRICNCSGTGCHNMGFGCNCCMTG